MKFDFKQILAYRIWSKILGDMFWNTHKKYINRIEVAYIFDSLS